MLDRENFFIDIERIDVAHKFTLDKVHKFECRGGRGKWGIVFAISNSAEYRFDGGERITIKRGDLILLSPISKYTIVTEKEFAHYTVNFDIHRQSSDLSFFTEPFSVFSVDTPSAAEHIFESIISAMNSKSFGHEMMAISFLYELLSKVYCERMAKNGPKQMKRLLPAKEYIEKNFKGRISLSHLADISDMSPTNFRREWKKVYSETPLEYKNRLLLSFAKEYLATGLYSVFEIADMCGFSDVSYFVRFFKKHLGVAPGEYKRSSAVL